MERGVVYRGRNHSIYIQGIILVANLPAIDPIRGESTDVGARNSFSMVVDGGRTVGPRYKKRVLSS